MSENENPLTLKIKVDCQKETMLKGRKDFKNLLENPQEVTDKKWKKF